MTEIDTGEGKLYLATVIDLFSRRCLGYAMDVHHDAALVSASLQMAAATRGGEGGFNWSSQHFDLGGVRRGHGGLEFEDQRCSGGSASAVAR